MAPGCFIFAMLTHVGNRRPIKSEEPKSACTALPNFARAIMRRWPLGADLIACMRQSAGPGDRVVG